MDCLRGLRPLSRAAALTVVVALLPAMTGPPPGAQASVDGEARRADAQSPADGTLRLAEAYDLPGRWNGVVSVGRYDWPYHDFGRDDPDIRARYRDYLHDYGNFAYDYSGFAPRYRDYTRDYGEFAFDYQPKRSRGIPVTTTGQVIIDVLPTAAEIFVDGRLIGLSYELSAGFMLESGPHRLEVRADDYEPAAVDVIIEPGRLMKFQGTLLRRQTPEQEPPPARVQDVPAPMTIYFIPGCYLGNVPPIAARLPAGCSLSNLKVFPR
jgi:hypothetical protein